LIYKNLRKCEVFLQQNNIMLYKTLFLSLLTFVIFSCKQSNSTPSTPMEALHIEVMAIHDEVMPKTSDLHRQIKKLKKLKKTIPENNTSFIKMIDKVIGELQMADDKMMMWMKQYKKPDFQDESEETKYDMSVYKKRIIFVRDKINGSLEKADQLEERFKVLEEFKKR